METAKANFLSHLDSTAQWCTFFLMSSIENFASACQFCVEQKCKHRPGDKFKNLCIHSRAGSKIVNPETSAESRVSECRQGRYSKHK